MPNRATKLNAEPAPYSLRTLIEPPIISASRLLMLSPSPVPPYLRVVEPSAWVKGWNSRACCSGVMPMPLSSTSNSSSTQSGPAACTRQCSRTWPLAVNLIALLVRLVSTWPSRIGSPTSRSGTASATSTRYTSPFSRARYPATVATVLNTSRSEKSIRSMSILPASIFEKSRMSLMMPRSDIAARSIFSM